MWAGSVLCRIALWDCFGMLLLLSLLGGCVGNWVEIHPPKQSHNAFRHNTDPVSTSITANRATDLATESLWWFLKPVCKDFRVFHSVFRCNKVTVEKERTQKK